MSVARLNGLCFMAKKGKENVTIYNLRINRYDHVENLQSLVELDVI